MSPCRTCPQAIGPRYIGYPDGVGKRVVGVVVGSEVVGAVGEALTSPLSPHVWRPKPSKNPARRNENNDPTGNHIR